MGDGPKVASRLDGGIDMLVLRKRCYQAIMLGGDEAGL
jgi:hypothetical protein